MDVHNLIILDESGSMQTIYQQALSGTNETLNGIRQAQTEYPNQRQFVSIVTFEGNGATGVKTRRDRVPVSIVEDMTEADYLPGGCTPLYDAMGQAITHLDKNTNEGDAVLVTIITDGEENSSSEYTGAAIKKLVARQKEKGWTFAYIGANQDAIEVAGNLNISNAMNFDATPEGTVQMRVKYEKARRKFLREVDCYMNLDDRDVEEGLMNRLGKLEDLFKEDENQ